MGVRKVGVRRVGVRRVGVRRVGPRRVGPRRVGPGVPKGGGPKMSLFFPPLPPHFSFFLPSLARFFRGVLVVFLKRRDPHMCTFGVLGLAEGGKKKKAQRPPETAQKYNVL